MSAVSIYIATLVATLVASLTVVLVLRRPLQRLLVDLCGTSNRAAFWTAFTNVALVLTPLLGAMHRRPSALGERAVEVIAQLEWALGGLLAAVLLIGAVLARAITAFERQQQQGRRAALRAEAATEPASG